MSIDIDTQADITWGAIGKIFSKKEIKKKMMVAMYKIQDELK